MEKPEGKRPLIRPKHRQVDNVKMDLGETGLSGIHWFRLAQDRDQWRAKLVPCLQLESFRPYTCQVQRASYAVLTCLFPVQSVLCHVYSQYEAN
jgi:hypothetical protein